MMIYDSTDNAIYEQSIVRSKKGIEQATVISIQHIRIDHCNLCCILTIYSLLDSKPSLLFYSFHPVKHVWVLVDKQGQEWEKVL